MALFKIFKGKKANLPQEKTDGYAYFTTDDGKFYIDSAGQGENLAVRTCINPTMVGATDETAGKEGLVPVPLAGDNNKYLKADGTWGEINITIPDLEDLTGILPISKGGTGATSEVDARNRLGLGSASIANTSSSVGNNSNLPTGAAIQSYVTGLGYQKNQNAFSNIKIDSTTIVANSKTDTFELAAGSNITITPDATNNKITITATDTTYSNASLGQGYGTCITDAATVAKDVTLASYALTIGGIIAVKFTNAVPANATLNVNTKGAKNIFYNGAKITANIIQAGDLATFIYDGTQYHLIAIDKGATTSGNSTVYRVTATSGVTSPRANDVALIYS